MKKFLILIQLFAFAYSAAADNQALKIWMTDGQTKVINLVDEPRTTFVDGNLVVTTKNTTISLPLASVIRYTYTSQIDGIKEMNAETIYFSNDDESVTFKGLKSGAIINIYSAAGMLVRQQRADQGTSVVSIADLPTGVYAIKLNGATYKIMKK